MNKKIIINKYEMHITCYLNNQIQAGLFVHSGTHALCLSDAWEVQLFSKSNSNNWSEQWLIVQTKGGRTPNEQRRV